MLEVLEVPVSERGGLVLCAFFHVFLAPSLGGDLRKLESPTKKPWNFSLFIAPPSSV